MPKVLFVHEKKEIKVQQGNTILKAAILGKIPISHKCGGKGSCTTCKVNLDPKYVSAVSEPSSYEQRLISPSQLQKGVRLACQTKVNNDIEVILPEDPLKAIIQAQLAKLRDQKDEW